MLAIGVDVEVVGKFASLWWKENTPGSSYDALSHSYFGNHFLLLPASPRHGSYILLSLCRFFFLSTLDMRRDVQEIFRVTPHSKQVMMFSATLAKEIRITCKKFMANVSIPLMNMISY